MDDGLHKASANYAAFISLWPFVKSGGFYVIEDIQEDHKISSPFKEFKNDLVLRQMCTEGVITLTTLPTANSTLITPISLSLSLCFFLSFFLYFSSSKVFAALPGALYSGRDNAVFVARTK